MLLEYLKLLAPDCAKDVVIHKICPLRAQGLTSEMYSFVLTYVSENMAQKKDFILRVYREGFEYEGPKEFALLQALRKKNFPVPNVYRLEENDDIIGKPFMVMEQVVGQPASCFLNDQKNVRITVATMAELLLKLHRLNPNCIQESKTLREQYQLKQLALLKVRLITKKSGMIFFHFAPLRQKRFAAALNRLEEVEPERFFPAILHMDYEPNHVIISNGRYIIVDWGDALVGDPAYDVAYTYHQLRLAAETSKVDLGEYFVECYEKYLGQSLVNLQFHKDMVALELAMRYYLPPFQPNIMWFFVKLVNLTFGDVLGHFSRAIYLPRLQRFINVHHSNYDKSVEYYQNYVIQYLERDRYAKRNEQQETQPHNS